MSEKATVGQICTELARVVQKHSGFFLEPLVTLSGFHWALSLDQVVGWNWRKCVNKNVLFDEGHFC